MNSTQYGYHPYPSPSQTQTQTQQQQQMLSPQQQQQQLHSEQQQQLSPQLSPASSHQQSPEQQHTHQLSVDHGQVAMNGSSNAGNGHELNNTSSSNSGTHIEQHSPGHSNDVQSPIDAEGELIVPTPGGSSQTSQQQPSSSVASGTLHSPVSGQGHPTTLLPMPSPALAAATAANTAANTNSSASRQAILQQYQQQQQQQQQNQHQHQQHQHLGMGMPMSMQPTSVNGNPGAINTAMMSLQGSSGYMLPSPQSAGTGQPSLPALPPQSTDLDTILAKYANQPELLKLIIASKTEEDRRWAEEARYRMMDLIMRGENRGLGFMAGYEALGGIPGNMPGTIMGMTAKRFMEEGGYGHHPGFTGFPPPGQPGLGGAGAAPGAEGVAEAHSSGGGPGSAGAVSAMNPASTAGSTSAGGISSMYAPTQMLGMGGMGGMAGMGHPSQQMMIQGMGVAPGGGFGQYIDPSLARKRSVTFAGEVHHMRSQSLSSIPSPGAVGQLGNMTMMGMGVGGTDAFGQHHQHQAHQQPQTSALQGPSQYQFQQQQQQQQHQQQQQQQQMQYHHHAAQPPLPPFAGGGNPYAHQSFTPHPSVHHHSVIRRTNSLSHISHTQTTVTEQRLVAGRPRNDSSASIRNMDDDSDEDSDEDYDNHPVMGMSSRPGSALSMHNNMGGNGETSLTLEFSDMASVSGGGGGHHHHHHEGPNLVNGSIAAVPGSGGSGGGVSGTAGSTSTTTTASTKTTKSHRSTPSTSSLSGMTGDAGSEGADYKRKRKRREMQPVNKTVESPEPYVDPYLWKNNGNTTQKKTGCKSIYYKCSNSPAGCTVNKTVTEKEGGGYITKYRGEHLEDCIRLKKAQMAAQAAQAAAQNGHHSIQKEQ